MSEKEKSAFVTVIASANDLVRTADEGTVLAITASYLAGKEAGKREAKAEVQSGVNRA